MTYQYHEFTNGIRLVHRQQRGQVAHLGIIVNAGSRDEAADQQGMAHFIEHLIFKGTERRTNFQVLNRLENVGADLNAFTTREDTSVYVSIQERYFARAAELLADILFRSVFPLKEIEKEKAVVIDEINSYKDNPAEWIHDEFDELIFGGHPLGRNILGTKELLKKYTRDHILKFQKQHYQPSRMVISSIGSFNFGKAVAVIEKYFGNPGEATEAYQRSAFIPNTNTFNITRRFSKHQSHAVIGNLAFSAHDERRIAMALLNNILGGPAMSSRLNMALREKHGIAYNLESNYQPFSDTGLFSIYCGTDDFLMPKAIDLIHNELRKFTQKALGQAALHTAQKQLKGQMALSLESHQSEMLAMGKSMLVYNRVDSVAELYRKIDAVNPQQILEVANMVCEPSKMSSLIFNNQKL